MPNNHTQDLYNPSGIGNELEEQIFSEMRYVAIVLLDDFNETNGCTYYIPKSHLKRQNPKRNRKYNAYEEKCINLPWLCKCR